ncbi:hypothetical protein Z517_05603 [Fonsecaea pedrosoi CBS 271.37]|uniref:Uncharacterized protein n=1 Tax=Fonsecaea pedrosoi CBS 271.37 TaxID=1442368 RepID=A0A0D2DXS6_9EURO|nr:uncharacterized protein Z517_05603 [Fonsecaea pedrosoi CBS 271.37]KIW82576.1 hypothetical protein Z517_05603 [Fonsecaea pedrosoi CBS 271.37]
MPRVSRRYVKSEHDESEEEALPPMSPNTQKDHHLKMIQRMDLCEKNADAIKTSDYPNRPRLFTTLSITPECNIEGTEAARIASAHKAPTAKWQTFGQSDEAVDVLFNQKQISNGNKHRHALEEQKKEEEARLGHKLSLADTYNEYGGNRRAGKRVASLHARPAAASLTQSILSARPVPAVPKDSGFWELGKGAHVGPLPPPALEGTASKARAMQLDEPAIKMGAIKVSAMPAAPAVAVNAADLKRRALTLPAKPYSFNLVEDPSQFMSSIKGKLTTWLHETQAAAPGMSTSATNAVQGTLAAPSTMPPVHPEQISDGYLHDPSIRRVPVSELSFSRAHSLAPGNVSTHTDGTPSSAALSGFSASATNEKSSTAIQAVTDDLIGLGIENATLSGTLPMATVHSAGSALQASPLSDSGSLLDSPIPDKVSSQVLPAQAAKVVIVHGHRYVHESELFALKKAIIEQFSNTTANLVGDLLPSKPLPNAVPVTQRSLPTLTVPSSVTAIAPLASRPDNPFAPREPLATNNSNISQVSSTISKETSNPPPTAKPAARPSSVVTSNKTVFSKWADEPAARPSSVVTSNKAVSPKWVDESAAQPSSVVTSNKAISSKWADEPAARPSNPPRVPVVRPSSPLIGDRKVFGHLSKEAAAGQKYDSPQLKPKQPVMGKRRYEPPGPGLTRLLQEIAEAKQESPASEDKDEEL